MPQPSRESSAPDRLVDAAVEIARARGLAALTARALSERTGQSPSALNYHMGGRDALVALIHRRALEASAAWRAERLAELAQDSGAPSWSSPAGAISALIDDRAGRFRSWGLLLAEFESLAETQPALAADARSEIVAMTEFWRHAAHALGESDEVAALVWVDLAMGLSQMFRDEDAASQRLPWILDAASRVAARLRAETITPAPDRHAGAEELLHAQAPTSDGARRILEAAIRVLAERGADRLTQREVAAAAGLSLAAVTYFHRSKADLVAAAFHELHRQISAEALAMPDKPGGTRLAQATLEVGGDAGWRLRAMEALQLAAARDPSLAPIVRSLRTTRGATSIGWLRSQGVEADRLDAFVFSTTMSGVVQRTRLGAAGDRRMAMEVAEKRLLSRLFGL